MNELYHVNTNKFSSVDQHAPSLLVVIARYSDHCIFHFATPLGLLLREKSAVGKNHGNHLFSEIRLLGVFVFFEGFLVQGKRLKSN